MPLQAGDKAFLFDLPRSYKLLTKYASGEFSTVRRIIKGIALLCIFIAIVSTTLLLNFEEYTGTYSANVYLTVFVVCFFVYGLFISTSTFIHLSYYLVIAVLLAAVIWPFRGNFYHFINGYNGTDDFAEVISTVIGLDEIMTVDHKTPDDVTLLFAAIHLLTTAGLFNYGNIIGPWFQRFLFDDGPRAARRSDIKELVDRVRIRDGNRERRRKENNTGWLQNVMDFINKPEKNTGWRTRTRLTKIGLFNSENTQTDYEQKYNELKNSCDDKYLRLQTGYKSRLEKEKKRNTELQTDYKSSLTEIKEKDEEIKEKDEKINIIRSECKRDINNLKRRIMVENNNYETLLTQKRKAEEKGKKCSENLKNRIEEKKTEINRIQSECQENINRLSRINEVQRSSIKAMLESRPVRSNKRPVRSNKRPVRSNKSSIKTFSSPFDLPLLFSPLTSPNQLDLQQSQRNKEGSRQMDTASTAVNSANTRLLSNVE